MGDMFFAFWNIDLNETCPFQRGAQEIRQYGGHFSFTNRSQCGYKTFADDVRSALIEYFLKLPIQFRD